MASQTDILLLADLATGESGVLGFANWGEAADSNFAFLEDTIGEVSSIALTGTSVTLTAAQERSLLIKLTGTLSANVNVNTNDRKGFWFVKNETSGSFSVTFKTTSGTGVTVPQGGWAVLVSDGTDVLPVLNASSAAASLLDDSNVSAMRTTLGLGTAAVKNTGTSGDAVGLLDGANTWSALQTFNADIVVEDVIQVKASTGSPFIQFRDGSVQRGVLLRQMSDDTIRLRVHDSAGAQIGSDLSWSGSTLIAGHIIQANNTGSMSLSGGNSTSAGANIELYGGSHASQANNAFYDAAVHTFRSQSGGTGASVTVQGDLTVSGALTASADLSVAGDLNVTGSITGNGSGITSLSASNLASGTVPSARVSGSYTGITGVGALAAGSIASTFGSINIGSSSLTCGETTVSGAIHRNVNDASLVLDGGSASGNGANIELHGGSHSTLSNQAFYDASAHTFRGQSGDASTTTVTVQGTISETSDIRLKEDIRTFASALETVQKLRGVRYRRKANGAESVGFIAQELEMVLPELVHEDADGMKSVSYSHVAAVLVEAVKELSGLVDELKYA